MAWLKPFSDQERGLFVSVDSLSGAGKSTIAEHLAQLLVADGEQVRTTAEPSGGPIGALAHKLTETVSGPALACLYSADRYHHLEQEIRPRVAAGEIVLCDRYVPSGLVMQRFDGVDPAFLWSLNVHADRPDLAVVLEADPRRSPAVSTPEAPITASSSHRVPPMPKRTTTAKPVTASSRPAMTSYGSTARTRLPTSSPR